MTDAKGNSNEEALKREKRSLEGKIKRRRIAITFAENDIVKYKVRLHAIADELAGYKGDRR